MEIKYQRNFPPCPKCGQPMQKRGKTCAACAGKGRGSLPRRHFVAKICKQCQCPFQIPEWRAKQNRGVFCSRECKDKHLTNLVGTKSIRWKGGHKGNWRGLGWKIAKQWAIVRANNKCEKCGNGEQLRVHHIKAYAKCKDDIEANSPKNLIVLCQSCHSKIEGLGKIIRRKRGDAKSD